MIVAQRCPIFIFVMTSGISSLKVSESKFLPSCQLRASRVYYLPYDGVFETAAKRRE